MDLELTVPGLLNSGDNLCYLNSSLQTLASSCSVLAAVQGSLECYREQTTAAPAATQQTVQPQLLDALADVLQRLQPCDSDERAALSPAAVSRALRCG